jgi:predicted  nucleic acid-binding Zn-ribbon protein
MTFDVTLPDISQLIELARLDAAPAQRPSAYREAREASRRRLPERLLERYETLLSTGRTPVLVRIEDGCCSACHVRLPTMVAHKARHKPAVHTCPCCRRMLYAPELLASPPAAVAPGDAAQGEISRPAARRKKTLAR